MSQEPQVIDKLALISVRDRKLLMVRSKGKDVWYTVGGKREEGESDEQALTREVKEELGVDLDPSSLKYCGIFEELAHGKSGGILVRLTCYMGSYTGNPTPSTEIEELGWFSYDQRNATTPAGQLVFEDLKRKGLIE